MEPGRVFRRGRIRGAGAQILNRQIWAWAFYDFANSPFATTILAVVFNVYFAGVVAQDAPVHGVTLWSFLVTVSTLIAGVLSPYLGAMADQQRRRKRWLAIFAGGGGMCTCALAVSGPGTWVISSILFILASACFSLSLTFYHSFLNDLANENTIGHVSGVGWACGYLGGGLCLGLNLLMIRHPGLFLLPEDIHIATRATFLVVGLWWLIFTLPLLVWVKEPAGRPEAREAGMAAAFRRVADSVKSARRERKNLFLFLIAYLLYNDAIETVIIIAAIFASMELGMGQSDLLGCFLMIQFIALFGALGFGKWADRWSNKKSLQVSLLAWSAILLWTTVMRTQTEFWIAGALIALVLGGSQSVSRSLFGKMAPKGDEAQFYGFFSLSGKISAAAGPLIFGVVHEMTGQIRWAIFSLFLLLVTGQILLARVSEPGEGVAKVEKEE